LAVSSAQAVVPPKGEARFIGDVPGCFVFLERTGRAWEAQTFPFSARSVSTSRAVIGSDTAVERGERIALRFDTVGIRRALVERPIAGGFIVNFIEGASPDADVDARIAWLNRKTRGRAEDRRVHKRVLPRDSGATLILGADRLVECRIVDMSRSGVAVRAAVQPPVGYLLAIGSVSGRVVRHFEGGFAVRFLELQDLNTLEGLMTLRTAHQKRLAAHKLGFTVR
jgi:hypothetical protein